MLDLIIISILFFILFIVQFFINKSVKNKINQLEENQNMIIASLNKKVNKKN